MAAPEEASAGASPVALLPSTNADGVAAGADSDLISQCGTPSEPSAAEVLQGSIASAAPQEAASMQLVGGPAADTEPALQSDSTKVCVAAPAAQAGEAGGFQYMPVSLHRCTTVLADALWKANRVQVPLHHYRFRI